MNYIKTNSLFLMALLYCMDSCAAKPAPVSMQILGQYITGSNPACFDSACKAVQSALPDLGYSQLEELHRLAYLAKYKVGILCQVSQANIWADFKEVIEQMNAAAQQWQKNDQRGSLYYAEQYVKQAQSKPEATAQRKQALELIQKKAYCALDQNFKEIMREAEQDPSKMQVYFSQAKQKTDAIYGILDAEYNKYEKVPSYDEARKMYGYRVVKKSEKEQNESSCALQ